MLTCNPATSDHCSMQCCRTPCTRPIKFANVSRATWSMVWRVPQCLRLACFWRCSMARRPRLEDVQYTVSSQQACAPVSKHALHTQRLLRMPVLRRMQTARPRQKRCVCSQQGVAASQNTQNAATLRQQDVRLPRSALARIRSGVAVSSTETV